MLAHMHNSSTQTFLVVIANVYDKLKPTDLAIRAKYLNITHEYNSRWCSYIRTVFRDGIK